MEKTLLETYKKRVSVAESLYKKSHNGEAMDSHKKILLAQCLKNVNGFLNEAFTSTQGTQQADLGMWKRFCTNLTNVALPTLIGTDLVMTHPMTSMTGYIAYLKFTAGTTKGDTTSGDLFRSPFANKSVDETYTSSRVVESFTGDNSTTAFALAWDAALLEGASGSQTLAGGKVTVNGVESTAYTAATANGVTTVTFTTAPATGAAIRIAYVYDNIVVPQNALPTLKAEMASLTLTAKARRIAVMYSQIAAFQAKTDYGFDLGDQLAEQAAAQLAYEIDTEITTMLAENADDTHTEMTFSKTPNVGVSKRDHYAAITEVFEIGKQIIYDKTQKFAPNWLMIASDILPVLSMVDMFKAAPTSNVSGPYFAGTLGSLKVYVTPNIPAGTFVEGCNYSELNASAAVYAPYMPIIPTQMLQYADGGTTQGWSTMYDLQMLNADLLVKGHVTA